MSSVPALIRDRPDWDDLRAFLCLLLVTTGASLVLIFAEPLVVGPAYLFFGLLPGDDLETPFRIIIPCLLLLLAAVGLRWCRRPVRLGAIRGATVWSALPVGAAAVVLLVLVAWVSGVATRAPGFLFGGGPAVALLGMLLIVLQVASEEVLLRGLLQPLLIRAWGVATGIALAALAFAIVHFAGGWRNPVSLLNIVLAGIWFGLLAWRTGGVFAAVLAHFGYNMAEEMLFGASPNPGIGGYGSLFDFELSGHSIWGGSGEGFNASIVLTAVLLLIVAPLALGIPGRKDWKKGEAAA